MLERIRALAVLALLSLAAACGGGGGGGGSTPPPTPAPTITAIYPTSAHEGDRVRLTGTAFTSVQSVVLGATPVVTYTVEDTTRIMATVPSGATSGAFAVTTPDGTATSPALTVLPSPPTLTDFNPKSGPVGTPIVIRGSGFAFNSTVTINGTIPSVTTYNGPTELVATVQAGTTTGPITVTKPGYTPVTTAGNFTVAGATTLDLFVDGWYLTQGTQDYAGSVPLVANRDGYLRVFVRANEFNTVVPVVRVTVNGGAPVVLATPSGVDGTTGVPFTINEGDLTKSWGLAIPAASIAAGMTLKIEVDPGSLIAEADETDNTVDAAPSPATVPPFHTTIIPVAVTGSGLTGNVNTLPRTLASWVDRFQRMYPVQSGAAGIDAVKGSVFTYTGNLGADGTGWSDLLGQLNTKHYTDPGGSARYYYGALNLGYASGVAGLGYVPPNPAVNQYRTAIGWDKTGYGDGGNYPEVYAHEVGHNLGRWHAPCGDPDPSSLDPTWPTALAYDAGSIGVYGYDVAGGALKMPGSYTDIMGYCSPVWVSDHTYEGILAFRAASPIGVVVGAPAQDSLLVWGRVKGGQVTLEPAFRIPAAPQPPAPGSYTLQLRDAQGTVLSETSFEPAPIADLPGEPEAHFAFTVPAGSGLDSLRVLRGGKTKALRAPSPAAQTTPAAEVRTPASVRMHPGEAHLGWDPMVHPKAMVRDPRTGEVIAFAEGGSVDVVTDASELEVTFSDGVNSTRRVLKVQ